ncbi:hypothetical protein TSUD_353240 [Trifolium subterraneum]|nr:hypothetical protein TSUD_353240 [Trifolium subterraneum]
MEKTVHIAVVPGVGYSHLVPILQFSKQLVQFHPDFHVTCFIPTLGSPSTASKSILQNLPSNINYTFLPPLNPNDLPQGSTVIESIHLTLVHSLPYLHHALNSLSLRTPIVALVVDPFSVKALDFAKEFNMLSYIYFPMAATTLCLSFYFPKLDEETSCEYKDLPEPVKLPGCVPIHGRDLFTNVQDRSSQEYKQFLQLLKSLSIADGILVNSFLEMERVLYVSFGSGGTLSPEQIVELALGLELSNHKFIWVVRTPSSSTDAAYLSAENDVDPLQFLPSGFLDRTKGKGLIIPSWAPQIQILSHSSVGGFLTHCGWNSILESVVHGVPLITWPLFAEQKMNAVLLSEGLKVGLRTRVNENDIVERVEVAKVIKCLMEGEEGGKLRNNMKELKEAANSAHKEDGSSTNTISQLALKWRKLVLENLKNINSRTWKLDNKQ